MPHQLDQHRFDLPDVEEWLSGDDRVLAFTVVDADGDPVDVSGATFEWALYDRAYGDDPNNAVLTQDAGSVNIVTSGDVDPSAGEWEVHIDGDATDEKWGEFWHRPKVTQSDGTTASWRGRIELTA